MIRDMSEMKRESSINTSLQRGANEINEKKTVLTVFPSRKTAEAVEAVLLSALTSLKRGVNETPDLLLN